MRALLITNPNSTSQSELMLRQVYARLREVSDLHLLVRQSHYPGHAAEMVSALTRAECDVVIAVGGDGTVNEIVGGLLGSPKNPRPAEDVPVLAVIPAGSANVFVRALGFPAEPADAAQTLAECMLYDLRRTIRLGTWESLGAEEDAEPDEARWFAVNAGFGLDADVLHAVDKARAKGYAATPLRYLRATLRGWARARVQPPHIDVHARAGERTLELRGAQLIFASNTNPWTFLGPLPVVTNPRNSFDKGLGVFGLTDIGGIGGFAGLLHLFGAYRLARGRVIQFDDAEWVELSVPGLHRFQADGESEGKLEHVRLRSIPDALEVYSP